MRAREEDQALRPTFLSIPYVPRVGDRVNPQLYRYHLRKHLQELRKAYAFDRLLCAWLFPDGWAVKEVAHEMGLPFALIAQGSDVHQYLKKPFRKKRIVETANQSLGVITRSADLGERLILAGVNARIPHAVYNGVKHSLFHPGDVAAARKALELPEHSLIILFVGNLLPIKQPELILQAFARFVEQNQQLHPTLVMLGDGPLRTRLENLSAELGIRSEVKILGQAAPEIIAQHMQAADLLTLASQNEGVPNVILESLASGLPVVAPAVGGIPEIIHQPALGLATQLKSEKDLLAAWTHQFQQKTDPFLIAQNAQQFTWEKAAERYEEILRGEASSDS